MKTYSNLNNRIALALAGLISGLSLSTLAAANSGYRLASLVSDQAGTATYTDPNLLNPWGFLAGPGGRLIVADNHAGLATLYSLAGRPVPASVTIPTPDGSSGGAVTDVALNKWRKSFEIQASTAGKKRESTLLFVTEDGTICGWDRDVNPTNAVVAVDNSKPGAIYKGVALVPTRDGPRLFAANFGQGMVEMYDSTFHLVKSFTDSTLASASYVPFGIRAINGRLLVTFVFKKSPSDTDETTGPGLGYVDEFDLAGNHIGQLVSQGPLNAPWGMAMAPKRFGQFGGALLVGNFGDGRINAFDPKTGAVLGQLTDSQGVAISIDGLWGLAFGPGGGNQILYFTAGPGDEEHGRLGDIRTAKAGMKSPGY